MYGRGRGSSNPQAPSARIHMGPQDSPKLYALTIGINQYLNTEYTTLKGCAADADAVEAYLETRLFVSKSQITSLRNEHATRSAIIQAFRALKDDDRIPFGNPILIYFAGHGGLATAPKGWPCSAGKVQMIIPHDCGCQVGGEIVHGIPDITIAWNLKRIAEKRGNNITVIFDNCFSGSGTRSLNSAAVPSQGTVRAVSYRAALPETLDGINRIHLGGQTVPHGNNERGIRIASDYVASGQRSHILLAACRSNEYAREANKRGVFTHALLQVLSGLDISTITYKDLLKRIPHLSTDQNPQCEGHGQNRIIFGAQIVTQPTGIPYEGRRVPSNGILELRAGAAQGLGRGDVLNIWRDLGHYNAHRDSPLGTAEVSGVKGIVCQLATATAVPNSFVADLLESKRLVLNVYIPPEPCMRVVIDGLERVMQHPPPHRADILVTRTLETARIAIIYENNQFCFDIHDIDMNHYGLTRLPHTVPSNADKIVFQRILNRISIYEYYLRQVKGISGLGGKVSLEFFRLRKPAHAGHEDWNVGEIQADNLSVDGAGIDLVEDRSRYVIKLSNRTQEDLYPSLFYFDNCDYSIDSLYEPPSAGRHVADPPLKARSSMIIGYGSEGVSPFVLDISVRSSPMEVGFLKLFISTQYVDHSNIPQETPFKGLNSRGLRPFAKAPNEYFGTVMVPLVVRKGQSPRSPATRGIERHPQLSRATASGLDTSVFKRVPIDQHTPFLQKKLYDIMQKLKGGHRPQHHPLSEPPDEQMANMHLSQSNESYLHEAFRELEEIEKGIDKMKVDVSDLESKHEESSQELDSLTTRVDWMEWRMRSPNSTTG